MRLGNRDFLGKHLGQLDHDIPYELVLACKADCMTHWDTEGFSICGPKISFKNNIWIVCIYKILIT